MDAWGDTGEKKQFGVRKALFFSLGRIWGGTCRQKMLLIFNLLLLVLAKGVQVINPIFLMLAINGILCKPEDQLSTDAECPTHEEVYMYILIYAGFKIGYDFIHSFREIPFAWMSAQAEISIANDVYFHVQSLSLAYHLSRETGKVIRIVSRGSQSFVSVLRMMMFNILGLSVELLLTMAISLFIFSWKFTIV